MRKKHSISIRIKKIIGAFLEYIVFERSVQVDEEMGG
jgi:hypothetical protein